MTVVQANRSDALARLLEAREPAMSAVESSPWLEHLRDVPDMAGVPLAMSSRHPDATGSYGSDYVAWAKRSQGLNLRWWQELAAYRQLEHDAEGRLVWREVIESGPRRIGKSVRLRSTALWRCSNGDRIGEQQLAMLVSKDLAVGKEIHRGAWRWAEENDWGVLRLGGAQEVESPSGDRWLLRAPNACYGYDVGYGQVDEAWGVDPTAITDGLEPALLERLWPQLHLTSTAHVKASSLMRRRLVAALRNADPNVLLLMWGAHPESDFTDESSWRLASPHWSQDRLELMRRKYAAALAGQDEPEFDDPDPVRGWAAQYLNVWPLLEGTDSGTFPHWSQRTGTPGEPTAFGLSCDRNRRWLYLGGSDGTSIRLVTPAAFAETGPMVPMEHLIRFLDEVARIARDRGARIAIQERGPAWHLRDLLTDRGADWVKVTFEEFADASGDLDQRVTSGPFVHSDEVELNDAARDSIWRKVGLRNVLAGKDGANVAALEAALLALSLSGKAPDTTEPFALWG